MNQRQSNGINSSGQHENLSLLSHPLLNKHTCSMSSSLLIQPRITRRLYLHWYTIWFLCMVNCILIFPATWLARQSFPKPFFRTCWISSMLQALVFLVCKGSFVACVLFAKTHVTWVVKLFSQLTWKVFITSWQMTHHAALSAEMQTFSSSFSKPIYHQFYTAQKHDMHWSETCAYTEELGIKKLLLVPE